MHDFEMYLTHCLDNIAPSRVKDAMQYSLLAGGKRIRPQILFAALQAYGFTQIKDAYPLGAALEMIHTYSLIHDDLPAMDDDTIRRGKPTCHVQFDEATAILAGDALLTHAFYMLSTLDVSSDIRCEMITKLSLFSGANGMVLGQIKDMENETSDDICKADLEDTHFYKTGKLLTLPLLFAAAFTGHNEHYAVWEKIGQSLGLSFQIQDDILDVTSTKEVLGKNINSDAQNHKQTYVTLMGIDAAREEAMRYYQVAFDLLHTLHIYETTLEELFHTLIKRKH